MLTKQNNRQSNFELMRIIAMLMIIVSHYTGHGIINFNSDYLSDTVPVINKILVPALNAGGSIAVALFFMLTGFFLHETQNPKCGRVIIETCFYSILIVAVYVTAQILRGGVRMSSSSLLTIFGLLFIPISSNQWWFVTSYVILIFMIPYLNSFIQKLNRKKFLFLMLISIFFWQTFGFVGRKYEINFYYDLQKPICFYLLGAYISKYLSKPLKSFYFLFLAFVLWTIYGIAKYIFVMQTAPNEIVFLLFGLGRILLKGWIEPLIAFCFFMFFYGLNIGTKPIINRISLTTFGIYLIHENVFIKNILWNGIFHAYEWYKSPFMIVNVLSSSVIVFVFCSAIDFLRIKTFEQKILRFINKKIIGKLIGECK